MIAAAAPAPPVECSWYDLGCSAGRAIASWWDGVVDSIAQGAAELLVTMTTWWVTTDSVNPLDPAVVTAQGMTRDLIVLILVGSILVQSIRLILSRKGEPLLMVALGLVRFGIVSALGLVLLATALRAADALSTELIGGATDSFALQMRDALASNSLNGFVLLLFAMLAAVLAVIQWVLMALRQAGLLVLAAMLPLAASGSLTRSTRGWLDKLMVWLIAMVAYKPAAAFIYAIGFSYMSSPAANDDDATATAMTGIVVLLLAIVAMPVLLSFFSWTGTQIGGSRGGGSGFLGAAGAIAMSRGGAGRGAIDRAASIEASGPGSIDTGGGAETPAPSTRPAGAGPTSTRGGALGSAAAAASVASGTARSAGDQLTGSSTEEGS